MKHVEHYFSRISTFKFFWESLNSRLSRGGKKLKVYKKKGQALKHTCDAGYELTVSPPVVTWSDSTEAQIDRTPYEVSALPAGWGEIRNAFTQEGSNSIISGRNIYVDEYRNEYPQVSDPRSDPIVRAYNSSFILGKRAPRRNDIRNIDEAIWFAGRFSTEFGHFMNSFLPRIHWLKSHPMWGKIPVVISANLPKTHMEFLQLIGPEIQYVIAEPGEELFFQKLLFCPSRVFSPYNVYSVSKRPQPNVFVEPVEFGHLRKALLDAAESFENPYMDKNFFLTRVGYDRRKLIDNSEIYETLEALGLEPINLASLGAREQVQFWTGANIVVGELSSWLYLTVLKSGGTIMALNSDRDSQWWADMSGIKAVNGIDIKLFLGFTVEEFRDDTSESGPHRPWTFSKKGVSALSNSILEEMN